MEIRQFMVQSATYCYDYILGILSPLQQRIASLWSNTILPEHYASNPYPRSYKRTAWPPQLDQACKGDMEHISLASDPLEQVSPLHAAVYGGNHKAIYRLIRDGADVNSRDLRGQTPAYWAAYYGNLTALLILKKYGAKLDSVDNRGKTPLRAAVKYGHTDVVHYLISEKVPLNEKDGRGLTPLHLAVYHWHYDIFAALAYAKADLEIKDPKGRTPWDLLFESRAKANFIWRLLFPYRKLIDRFEELPS